MKYLTISGCIRKIPLNPPLQNGEAVGMLGLIEMLLSFDRNLQITHVNRRRWYHSFLWEDNFIDTLETSKNVKGRIAMLKKASKFN